MILSLKNIEICKSMLGIYLLTYTFHVFLPAYYVIKTKIYIYIKDKGGRGGAKIICFHSSLPLHLNHVQNQKLFLWFYIISIYARRMKYWVVLINQVY